MAHKWQTDWIGQVLGTGGIMRLEPCMNDWLNACHAGVSVSGMSIIRPVCSLACGVDCLSSHGAYVSRVVARSGGIFFGVSAVSDNVPH